ncbi:MAG: hypothetical protein GY772_07075, partial [bacterium]|nr:hypothetical protein [bacterium]
SVSRLLWVEVGWRMPMQGESTAQVVVGHLHNSEAKRECEARNSYFDRLAQFCAGGARLLGMDLNMALFGLVEELGRRGVGCTLVSHHYEWRYDETLYDSLGLWVVGPMDVARSTILTPETLALAGAYHAILQDETPQSARGFPPRSHAWPVPALCRSVDVGPLSSAITKADSEFVTRHVDDPGMEDSLGVRPWADVRLHPRFCAGGDVVATERRELPWDPVLTYLRPPGAEQRRMPRTDGFTPMPRTFEILAQSSRWDPFGHRW